MAPRHESCRKWRGVATQPCLGELVPDGSRRDLSRVPGRFARLLPPPEALPRAHARRARPAAPGPRASGVEVRLRGSRGAARRPGDIRAAPPEREPLHPPQPGRCRSRVVPRALALLELQSLPRRSHRTTLDPDRRGARSFRHHRRSPPSSRLRLRRNGPWHPRRRRPSSLVRALWLGFYRRGPRMANRAGPRASGTAACFSVGRSVSASPIAGRAGRIRRFRAGPALGPCRRAGRRARARRARSRSAGARRPPASRCRGLHGIRSARVCGRGSGALRARHGLRFRIGAAGASGRGVGDF